MTLTVQLLRPDAYNCTITSAWRVQLYNYGWNQGCWWPIRFKNFDIVIIIFIIIIVIIVCTVLFEFILFHYQCSSLLLAQQGKEYFKLIEHLRASLLSDCTQWMIWNWKLPPFRPLYRLFCLYFFIKIKISKKLMHTLIFFCFVFLLIYQLNVRQVQAILGRYKWC